MQVGKEFGTVMKRVFDHFAALDFDEKTVNSIGRVVHIWAERGIFDKRVQGRARQNCQAVNWNRSWDGSLNGSGELTRKINKKFIIPINIFYSLVDYPY